MRIAITILIIISQHCYAQDDYRVKLSDRLEEIKKLDFFDNEVVVSDDTSRFGFPRWVSTQAYYQDDLVTVKGETFVAINDSKGKNPTSSPNEWRFFSGTYHPYQFLRDTAEISDLKLLLTSDHPYIRTYAFGALAHRKHHEAYLFMVVVDNLKDSTRIMQFTGDYGYTVCSADLMLWYSINRFSSSQKDTLRKLILAKHNHLNTIEEVLFFHKPSPNEYKFVKEIAYKYPKNKFALVALSKYCKPEDIDLIRHGFNLDISESYDRGYKVFFHAIENCPNKSFKQDLISSKVKETYDNVWIDEYYVRALASYKDEDCLIVLKELSALKSRYQSTNQATIYRALKKHYTPIYDLLMKEIAESAVDQGELKMHLNSIEATPWNY